MLFFDQLFGDMEKYMISRLIEKDGFDLDRYPDHCPACSHGVQPTELNAVIVKPRACVQIVYQCPRKVCRQVFVAEYRRLDSRVSKLKLARTYPYTFEDPVIEEEVVEISPAFSEIFTQASHAESMGLDQISGVGYRKALEFLIKDYCVKKHPDQADKIKAKLLGGVIADYVDDPKVKDCGRRASWLGNDETHYTRKWEDKDIGDLKALIRLTSYWIVSSVLSDRYIESMEH